MELKSLLENVRVGESTTLDLVADGKDKKITVELRKLLPEEPRSPKRKESPRRVHEFLSAKSLADYLAAYGCEKTVVFADPENEVVYAILDETATAGFQAVTMKPAPHPLWKPWAEALGRTFDVKDFAKFVTENRRAIVEPDGRALALELAQIRASVDVDIQVGRGKNAVNGLVVTTEIKGSSQSELVDLPDTITLDVPLYVDTSKRRVEADLCIEADTDGDVSVLLTAGTVAEAKVQAFEDMVALIRAGLGGKGVLTFGRPKHAAWDYLVELDTK